MTKSIATDATLTPFSYDEALASQAEAARLREERAPALEAANTAEAFIREEARRLHLREPKPTVTGGEWGGFTAYLVSACSLAGQASTAAANGNSSAAMEYIAEALKYLSMARAML